MLDILLAEAEQQAVNRNLEVIDSVVMYLTKPPITFTPIKRACDYMKALIRQRNMRMPFFMDDEYYWREWRSLNQKLKFKKPCCRCLACRQEGHECG